jgi:hypothetical protein
MSMLLIVAVVLVAVVVLSRLTWSSLSGQRRSLDRHERAPDVPGSLRGRPPARGADRDPRKIWGEVLGNEVIGPAKRRHGPRRLASGLLGYRVISRKTRPGQQGWTPLLAGALAVLVVFAISGTLIAGLMTSSTKRQAVTNSRSTVPITTPATTAPITAPPPKRATWPVSATRDVWLKTGPGGASGNVVILPGGTQGEVTCYDPNGQLETSTDGTSSTTWWRTYDDQNVGWISGEYLNTQGARSAPRC